MKLLKGEFELVAELVHELCGIVLEGGREYLIENRLSALATKADCATFEDLCKRIRDDVRCGMGMQLGGQLSDLLIDGITTNETRFFRDRHPFTALEHKILPEALDASLGRRKVRILSAACSTGQEPASIGMLAREMLGSTAASSVQIVGVDVSQEALHQARSGSYSDFDVQRSERPELTSKYLSKKGNEWMLSPSLRELIHYRAHNLLAGTSSLGMYDVIFCRNVAIYFEREDRERLALELCRMLNVGGWLFVGASESFSPPKELLRREEHCGSIVYRRVAE